MIHRMHVYEVLAIRHGRLPGTRGPNDKTGILCDISTSDLHSEKSQPKDKKALQDDLYSCIISPVLGGIYSLDSLPWLFLTFKFLLHTHAHTRIFTLPHAQLFKVTISRKLYNRFSLCARRPHTGV